MNGLVCAASAGSLQAASRRGVRTFILFANSPPISMTKNGKAFCEGNVGSTNLADEHFGSFASYLADVAQHFAQEGIAFDFVSPVNEPESNWDSPKQEGCRYANDEIPLLLQSLSGRLRQKALTTKLLVPESGRLDWLFENKPDRLSHLECLFGSPLGASMSAVTGNRICGHSYFTDTPSNGLCAVRERLREALDRYNGLEYWMTEYCILGPEGPGRPEGMDAALHVARVIHFDLAVAGASSWQWWLAVSVFDYKDGLIYADMNPTDGSFETSKILWAFGNYSRFIRPGARRVAVSRSDGAEPEQTAEGLMVSAYHDASSGRIVLVSVNRGLHDVPVRLQFVLPEGYPPVESAIPFLTSDRHDLRACQQVPVARPLRVPARSVVTLVAQSGNARQNVARDGD
jgi:O-glycosyl hydrolase